MIIIIYYYQRNGRVNIRVVLISLFEILLILTAVKSILHFGVYIPTSRGETISLHCTLSIRWPAGTAI